MQEDALSRDTFLAALEGAGELVLPLRGASMGLAWAGAEAVAVRAMRGGEPRGGDVVVFERHGRWYVHRVLLRIGDRCWTKGDARWAWDRPPVHGAELLGLVVGVMVEGRRAAVTRSAGRAGWELVRALAAWPMLRWR